MTDGDLKVYETIVVKQIYKTELKRDPKPSLRAFQEITTCQSSYGYSHKNYSSDRKELT